LLRGDASAIDARLAEVEAARAQEELFSAEQAGDEARLELCALSGWPEPTPPLVAAELEPPRAVPSLELLLAPRAAEPPELVAKRAARREAEARAELAEREGWPDISLGVQYTRESDVVVNDIVVGTLGVELPLWQHNQAERERALGEAGLARAEEQASAARLRLRVRLAYRALEAARLRLGRFDAALATPVQEGLRLLRRGFEAGEIALGELTFAHERWLMLQRENLEVYTEYYRALAALESALGVDLGLDGGAP
jgi:cobalt-zinc-cadmium efflux system outer membrane protein